MSLNSPNLLPKIVLLGIGLMGQPMAARLLRAGYSLSVWNRTRSKAYALAQSGALIAETAADAVRDADIIITMLESGPVVNAVVTSAGPDIKRGALLIDMSSTRQSEAQQLHADLKARDCGFIDAPVSGGVLGAEAGALAIMVGGAADDFRRALPILQTLGRPTWVGPPGSGQLAKLCNQLIVGATLEVVAEALLMAQAGGADPAAVRDALRGGFAESRILEVHGQRMLERNFIPGGQVKSQTKDMENVLAAASDIGLRLPVAELIAQVYRNLLPKYPRADQSAALLALEEMNPGQRVGHGVDQFPT